MKDKFELLNDVKIDTDEYKEVKFDNNDDLKNRMKSKIKSRKKSYKKPIVAASLAVILGCGLISNETVWANVGKIWYSMQRILDLKNEEITGYKYEINKSVESKNIKVTYKNLMIDDGNLIVEIDVDDSKFNPFEDFTEKQQKDWNVEKWGNKETFISVGTIESYVDGMKRGISGAGQSDYENKDRDSKGITSVVSVIPINEIEGKDSIDEVGNDKFPYTIDKNKIYNIKLNINKIHLTTEWIEEEKKSYGGAIWSDWGIDLSIKGEDLIKSTVNYENYKIDKNIKINIDGIDKEIHINDLNLSPIYVKLQYITDMDGYYINDKYDIDIRLENEKNEEYQLQYMSPNYNDKNKTCEVEVGYRNIFRDSKVVRMTPIVTELKSGKLIEQESITINLDNNNY